MHAIEIDLKLKTMVASERKITLEILQLIQILDISRSYLELGFPSLFEYLTKGIGYSEGAAQRRISSARLLKQIPQIETEIKSGELSLTQVALAQSAIFQQEKSDKIKIPIARKFEILNKLKQQTTIATKTILQSELPKYDPSPKTQVTAKPDSVSVTLTFSKSEWTQIQSFLARNSHKIPDQKIESLLLKISNQDSPPPLRRSRYIPAKIRREIFTRANSRCEFLSKNQHRCLSRHFLEIDHIRPKSLGGNNSPDNLRLLCRAHNFLAAKKCGITKPL